MTIEYKVGDNNSFGVVTLTSSVIENPETIFIDYQTPYKEVVNKIVNLLQIAYYAGANKELISIDQILDETEQ